LDTEQNERLQEEEHEIVRLWKARNSVLSQLESSKQPISSAIDDNTSISEIESRYDENESVKSQQTDYPKLTPKEDLKSSRITFSTRLRSNLSSITPTSSFVNRNTNNQNGHSPSIISDDRSSGVESLIPSPISSPILWRTEKVLGRGLCSSAIDYNRMNIKEARAIKPYNRNDTCSESDIFKDVNKSNESGFFANIRARMKEAAASNSSDTPLSFQDQYINAPLLMNTKKTHFDYDEVRVVIIIIFKIKKQIF
jgi:hypothetical protein